LDSVDHVVERSQLPSRGGGDRDDVATPVVGIDRALDRCGSLELAQPRDEVAAVDAGSVSEVGLADRTEFLERGEQA